MAHNFANQNIIPNISPSPYFTSTTEDLFSQQEKAGLQNQAKEVEPSLNSLVDSVGKRLAEADAIVSGILSLIEGSRLYGIKGSDGGKNVNAIDSSTATLMDKMLTNTDSLGNLVNNLYRLRYTIQGN